MNQIMMHYSEYFLPLTNSQGFGKFVRFDYRVSDENEMPLVISPHILVMGNPQFTRQAYYFLSDMECVIRRMIPEISVNPSHPVKIKDVFVPELQKAANDCLFEYSLKNPLSRLTIHAEKPIPNFEAIHSQVHHNRQTGQSLEFLKGDDGKVFLLTPDAAQEFERIYSNYVRELNEIGIHTAKPGVPKTLEFHEIPYSYEELSAISRYMPLDSLIPTTIKSSEQIEARDKLFIQREGLIKSFYERNFSTTKNIPNSKILKAEIFRVETTYNPLLLNFYFAGLRSLSPITEFGSYYNVIEYFFETVALEKAKRELASHFDDLKVTYDFTSYIELIKKVQPASDEKNQIREVVKKYATTDRIKNFLKKEISSETKKHFETYSHQSIQHLKTDHPDLQSAIADRIYTFRNAVFHSKKTWKGKEALSIRPFSIEESKVLKHEVLLVKMVAQEIIKQADPQD